MIKIQNKKLIVLALLSLLSIILMATLFWLSTGYTPKDDAKAALISTESVNVENAEYISFIPKENSNTGIIFYPGGRVFPEAYSPLLKSIAEDGTSAFIVKMPFNLAVLNIFGADSVIAKHSNIENWILMGHSLGGSMVVNYFNQSKNPTIKGIILLASYPANSDNISESGISVLSIRGENDLLLNSDLFESTKLLLPVDTKFVSIEGGNHAQFGDYGLQDGDGLATISAAEQREITLENIILFLNEIKR